MSKNKAFLVIACISVLALTACEKDTTDNVSSVFKVPFITINGEAVSLRVGSTYTDAGAKFTDEDGSVKDIQATSTNLNTAQPGLYVVDYQQTSTSGIYEAEAQRAVAVTDVNNPVDYSGSYLREATGEVATITKVGQGLYRVQNPGGASGAEGVVVHFAEVALNTFVAPPQLTIVGDFAVTDITFTETGASWKVVNTGYGTQLRFFVKL